MIPAASIVECPQRVEKLVELLEVACLDPVPPRGEKIVDLERKLREAIGITVLGSVAMTLNEKQRKRRARGVFVLAASYLSLLSAYGAIMASLILSTTRV